MPADDDDEPVVRLEVDDPGLGRIEVEGGPEVLAACAREAIADGQVAVLVGAASSSSRSTDVLVRMRRRRRASGVTPAA